MESATSGRSTPQHRPNNLSKETGQVSNGVVAPTPITDLNLDSMSLTDLLVKFSSDIASRAALEHERNQARDLLSGAQREYNEMKKHFKSYPAIEERKTEDRKAAQEALKAKEKLLNEQTTSQQTVAQGIASILSQLATPKPNLDTVSRAEYESLKKELEKEAASSSQLRNEVDTIRQTAESAKIANGQVSKFQGDLAHVKNQTTILSDWMQGADDRFSGLTNFGQRLGTVEGRSASTKKALDEFMDQKVDKLATKQDVNELEKRVQDVQTAQAKSAAERMSIQAQAKSQAVDPFSDARFQTLVDGHEKHAEEIKNLQLGGNRVFFDVRTKIDEVAQAQEDVSHRVDLMVKEHETTISTVDQLGTDILSCKEDIGTLYESIEEEGKETIVKRVKRLDVLVNNLSSKLGDGGDPATIKRLTQLEKDCKVLQQAANVKSTVSRSQSSPVKSTDSMTNGISVDQEFKDRLDSLQSDLDSFKRQQEELDEMLESQIQHASIAQKEVLMDEISQHLSAKRNEDAQVHSQAAKALENAINEMRATDRRLSTAVQDLQEAVRSKTSIDAMGSLKATVTWISGEVEKLQAQHQRTKSISQSPANNQAAQPNGFHGGQQSPQLPNGIAGSPQLNGPHRPHSPFTALHAHGQQAQIQAQQLQDLQAQFNGLVNAVQHIKGRCDNLQTDDVVRAMLEQFNSIYPDAKNINAAIGSLRSQVASTQQQISVLQQKTTPSTESSSEDIKKAMAKADGANNSTQSVSQDLQKLRTEINTIREIVRTVENNTPSAATSSDSNVKGQLSSLRTDLDRTTATAREADRLSKQHASRFSKIQPEELKTRVATLEGTVEEHGKNMKAGQDALKEFNEGSTALKSGLNRVKKTVAEHDKRITDLEAD